MKKQILSLAIFASATFSAQLYSPNGAPATTNINTGNVGIGINDPTDKLSIFGDHYNATIRLQSIGNGSNQPANLNLWASEPGVTYAGVGIGNNIRNFENGESFKLITPNIGGSYMRLLPNQINLNVVSATGLKKQMMTLSDENLQVTGKVFSAVNSPEGGSFSLTNPSKTVANSAQNWSLYNMTGTYGNSLQFWAYLPNGNGEVKLKISDEGNMALYGKLEAKEIKVTLTPTADFVFEESYNLPKLEEVEKHIKEKKHLPEIASAKQMEKEGVNVGEFQIKLLQKIEELTLYTIEQNKRIKELESKINKN